MISILNLLLIPLFLWIICYMVGSLLTIKKEGTILERFIWGLIGTMALFQLIALPFMYYETSFTPLYILSVSFIVLVICLYIVFCVQKKIKNNFKKELLVLYEQRTKTKILLWIGTIGLIALQIFSILYFQRPDPDDAYYLAQTNTVLETNYLMNIEPTTGIDAFEQMAAYKLVGHEVLLAVIAKLFRANVAFLCHMIFPIFMIPIHYAIVYELAKVITYKYKEIFVLLSVFVNLFACFSGASAGAFLSYRIWQGKAILVSILLPILLLEFWKIYERKKVSKWSVFTLILILWAGFCATSVGLYLIPIAYFMYTATFFFSYKDIKNSLKLCFPIVLSVPFVFVKLLSLFSQNFSGEEITGNISYFSSFFQKYLKGLQDSSPNYVMAVFFMIAVIYIWKKGNKLEKMVAVYAPIVLFLTFANPVFFSIISNYVTGASVYWRLFWLPQFRYIVVIAMLIYISEDFKRKNISTLVMILIITGTGDYVFKEPRYTDRVNRYKISDKAVWISEEIMEENDDENNYLLIPDPYSYEVRQYTGAVRLVWGRYAKSFYNASDYMLLETIYSLLYEDKEWNTEWMEEKLRYLHVNYVFLYKDSLKNNEVPDDFEEIFQKDDYVLFKLK